MRKDFDYVDFKDYQGDMDELASIASEVAKDLQRELRNTKALLWAAVIASGGKIEVPCRLVVKALDADRVEWSRAYCHENDSYALGARLVANAANSQSPIEERSDTGTAEQPDSA